MHFFNVEAMKMKKIYYTKFMGCQTFCERNLALNNKQLEACIFFTRQYPIHFE